MISTARAARPGWCCCCRRPERPACGGRPQSKNYWNRRMHCRSACLWCGSQSCRRIGRDLAGWFNPEFQIHGLSSSGTITISSLRLCTASFLRSLAVASETGFFGTWLCSMGSKRSGAILRLCLLMDPLWMQRPTSESDSHRSQIAAWGTKRCARLPNSLQSCRAACSRELPSISILSNTQPEWNAEWK
jgi:hypothetical protein